MIWKTILKLLLTITFPIWAIPFLFYLILKEVWEDLSNRID